MLGLQWQIQDFQEGVPTPKLLFGQFLPQKLHENERILTGRGCASPWVRQCFITHQHRWVTLSLRLLQGI